MANVTILAKVANGVQQVQSTDTAIVGAGTTSAGAATNTVTGTVADGSSAIGVTLNNSVTLANATARIASFKNNGTEKSAILKNGELLAPSVGPNTTNQHTLPAVTSGNVVVDTATQTLTNKTLTSATLGGNLNANSKSITSLAAPTPASSDAATATYAEAQKTGGAGPKFWLNTAGSWATNGYLGIADDGSSTVNVNVVPWIAPCAGTLKNLRVFGFQTPSGPTPITIYKATVAASPSYSATALTCTVAGGANTANDTTHSVSVSAGDLIVAFCSAFWATNGCCVTTQFIPT